MRSRKSSGATKADFPTTSDDIGWCEPDEIHINSPLRLIFTYQKDGKNLCFFYQSVVDGQYFHAVEKSQNTSQGPFSYTTSSIKTHPVAEEEVVANLFSNECAWIDKIYPDWTTTLYRARGMEHDEAALIAHMAKEISLEIDREIQKALSQQ